ILYTRHELNYDGFHRQADRIYRMSGRQDGVWFAALSAPYASSLYQHPFPEVETTVRMRRWPPRFIRRGEDKFYEPNTFFTDTGSAFFSLFDFPFLKGSPVTALSAP